MKDRTLHLQALEVWEKLGPWWDAQVSDGDLFHRTLLFPVFDRFMGLTSKDLVLDAGCGNGALARRMAAKGGKILGIDASCALLQRAQERSRQYSNITYKQIDLIDKEQLAQLGAFDHVVCSMVLHDLSDPRPFFETLKHLLKPHGSFLFAIPHPCFNGPPHQLKRPGCVTVERYITPYTAKIRSKVGQPIEQIVFLRPMKTYFNLLMDQGLVMVKFEEPCADPELFSKESVWGQRTEIPPALVTQWRYA